MTFTPKPLDTHVNWRSSDVADPASWTIELSASDHAELDAALKNAKAASVNMLEIGRDDFPLDGLVAKLAAAEQELRGGRVCLNSDRRRISGSSAGCFLDLPIWGCHAGRA